MLDYAVGDEPHAGGASRDELFAALREHFDERQLVELTNVIALENMRARFNSAFDMTPAGFSEGMVCVAPEGRASAADATACRRRRRASDRRMRVFLAGATGAIGRRLRAAAARRRPRGHRHDALAGERARRCSAAGAEPVLADALDADGGRERAVEAARPRGA